MEPCKQCGRMTDSLFGPGLCIFCHTGQTSPDDAPAADPGLTDAGASDPEGSPAADPPDGGADSAELSGSEG